MNIVNNSQNFTRPKVLYVQYTNPGSYPPLQHSSRILAQAGWEVLFLGTGAFGASALSFPSHPQITLQLMPFCSSGWRQKLHYLKFCLWVLVWTLRWQPQWVYASDILSCPIAMLLSWLPNVSVIYHEHDSPNSRSKSLFMQICLMSRKCLSYRAKVCVLPNQKRVEQFKKVIADSYKVFCVWNCPTKTEVCSPIPRRQTNELWVWYHGSIVPVQLPVTIIYALASLPNKVKLCVAGYETIGHQGYIQQLQKIAHELGISKQIEYIGTLPTRDKLIECCRNCDIGIALFTKDIFQAMPGASNKPFDYMACSLPLLVSDLPDWKQMYVEPGYGLACNPDDPESIAAALRWYLEHPIAMRAMGDRGRQRILDEWNYEQQFSKIFEKISHI
jgi:glycosyltransferase involved in cell wall biosynthesis